ncbi:MAG: SDR family oxidoreductase [Syntrophorhabdales bacterium]|jgi:NAD(P)-dependent dehydrogenase (short-subunit alcohol dehydrogenase family)
MKRLEGKTALITGGGTGIGAAIAKRFVSEGASVCITGRRREVLDKLVRSLPPGTAATCSGDVSNHEDVKRMVATALTLSGRLDVLVSSAGMDTRGNIADIDPALWKRCVDVNLAGPFFLMRESIPHMVKGGGGSIINIASVGGLRCLPNFSAYCTSKAGLIMLTKQAALDYGPFGIRCNVVCPGLVRTPMTEAGLGQLSETTGTDLETTFALKTSALPLRRYAKPEEISGICCYLASDESSFMTGSTIVIDGGSDIVDVGGVVPAPPKRAP